MRDWFVAQGIEHEDAIYLTQLDTLRHTDPVLWALIHGLHTSDSIAKHILWPHEWVLGTLRQLKEQGLVWDREGLKSVIWETQAHYDLRMWIHRQRRPGGLFRRIDRNDD